VNDAITANGNNKRCFFTTRFDLCSNLIGEFSTMTNTFGHVFNDLKSTLNQSFLDAWPSLTATKVPTCRIDDKMRLDHTVS
jgi:hypothetical protein